MFTIVRGMIVAAAALVAMTAEASALIVTEPSGLQGSDDRPFAADPSHTHVTSAKDRIFCALIMRPAMPGLRFVKWDADAYEITAEFLRTCEDVVTEGYTGMYEAVEIAMRLATIRGGRAPTLWRAIRERPDWDRQNYNEDWRLGVIAGRAAETNDNFTVAMHQYELAISQFERYGTTPPEWLKKLATVARVKAAQPH